MLGGRSDGFAEAAREPDQLAERERQLDRIYNRLFRQYIPRKMDVPVVYFSADYTGRPLYHLSTSVEVVTIPGGHWGCITSHADVLAGHLQRLLRGSNRLRPSELPRQMAAQSADTPSASNFA